MIYQIVMDGQNIFAYTNELLLVSPSLDIELNSAGSLSFKMPYSHTYYDLPKLMTSDVEVYENGDLIWYGRVSEIDDQDMNRNKDIYCEGPLAFFNDTIQRPYLQQETTVHGFFNLLIDRHNDYAEINRQFTVGEITIPNYTITKEISDYTTTKDVIMNECVGSFGGYLIFRKENGVNYVDWLYDITAIAPQPVQYALNLVTLSKYLRGSSLYTSIIPLGKEVNGVKTTIESVNEGLDYLDSDLIETYGRITAVVNWSDVGEPEELLLYAQRWLSSQQFNNLQIECDAAELYYLDNSYQPFRVGQLVHVVSDPHAIDTYLPITQISAELDSPVKTISIGSPDSSEFTEMVSGGGGSSISSGGGGGGGGGGGNVDDTLSPISTNPVANRAITNKFNSLFVACTKEEYDALPDTKLTDGVVYFVEDENATINIVALTQAEYDALPDTKLSDNVYYYILNE